MIDLLTRGLIYISLCLLVPNIIAGAKIMNLLKNENPDFSWDVKLDKSLQQPVRVIAAKQNVEIRQFISDKIREIIASESE